MAISAVVRGSEPQCVPAEYRIIDLHKPDNPSVAQYSIALGISNSGNVVGEMRSGAEAFHNIGAFVWQFCPQYDLAGRKMIDLSDPPINGPSGMAIARDINIYDKIIGNTGDATTQGDIILWGLAAHSFQNLTAGDIEYPGRGNALNDNNPPTIVGFRNPLLSAPVGYRYVLNDKLDTLSPFDGGSPWIFATSEAFGISNDDRAVGQSNDATSYVIGACEDNQPPSTWWSEQPAPNNEAEGIPLPAIAPVDFGYIALDINNDHDVVGRSDDWLLNCHRVATFWENGFYNSPESLPFISELVEDTVANAISDPIERDEVEETDIVGRSIGSNSATLWRGNPGDWTAFDLNEISCNDLLPPLELREATAINNSGWIVGWMEVNPGTPEARNHAFLLIPFDDYPCPADLNHDGVVDGSDLLLLLANWGPCPDPCCCLADLNGDGFVDGSDLLILLAAWGVCPCFENLDDPPSLAELLRESGLTDEDWSEFVGVMMNGTEAEKANYLCWMENYFALCDPCPTCPDSDPFGE